jgi:hypothetical protein
LWSGKQRGADGKDTAAVPDATCGNSSQPGQPKDPLDIAVSVCDEHRISNRVEKLAVKQTAVAG